MDKFRKFFEEERDKTHAPVPQIFLEGFHKFPSSKLIFIQTKEAELLGVVSILIHHGSLWMNWILTSKKFNKTLGVSFFIYINLVSFCFEKKYQIA